MKSYARKYYEEKVKGKARGPSPATREAILVLQDLISKLRNYQLRYAEFGITGTGVPEFRILEEMATKGLKSVCSLSKQTQ